MRECTNASAAIHAVQRLSMRQGGDDSSPQIALQGPDIRPGGHALAQLSPCDPMAKGHVTHGTLQAVPLG